MGPGGPGATPTIDTVRSVWTEIVRCESAKEDEEEEEEEEEDDAEDEDVIETVY